MKFDQLPMEEIEVYEISPNTVVKKRKKRVLTSNKSAFKKDRDVWDYIILQTAIACGVLAILLFVNLIAGNGLSELVAKLGM